jgi:hypothetical protein
VRRLILAPALAGLAGALAAPMATGQDHRATYTCVPRPADCRGWRATDVALRWFANSPAVDDTRNCPAVQAIRAEGANRRTCEVLVNGRWLSRTATVRIDKSAPRLRAPVPDRPPDANGWYRSAVRVTYPASDKKPGMEVSGIASCTSFLYVGPDTAGSTLTGACRDRAGNASPPASFPLRFDSTPPVITGIAPTRNPDHRTWYTRSVGFSFGGTDTLSGLAACDPVVYTGPASPAAPVTGTCRDQAGNVGSRVFTVPFDATPPALGKVKVRPGDRVVRLGWAAVDAVRVEVSRSPGRGDDARTLLHKGVETRLADRRVRNGRRYEYRFKAVDQAGNVATRSIVVVPGTRLLAPQNGARTTEPPVLRWTPVRGARYYNVQLYRDGRKVLSSWPSRADLELRRRWEYRGRRRLEPGRYHWVVWPGEGPRERNAYGPRIGRRSFVIVPNA